MLGDHAGKNARMCEVETVLTKFWRDKRPSDCSKFGFCDGCSPTRVDIKSSQLPEEPFEYSRP